MGRDLRRGTASGFPPSFSSGGRPLSYMSYFYGNCSPDVRPRRLTSTRRCSPEPGARRLMSALADEGRAVTFYVHIVRRGGYRCLEKGEISNIFLVSDNFCRKSAINPMYERVSYMGEG